ncbi:MAG: YceK/YidQ family lipoprotein [Planctomycetes bacterium]|nr:YceK/YidQ family lipoprotein [Planctomycetota bacterium]
MPDTLLPRSRSARACVVLATALLALGPGCATVYSLTASSPPFDGPFAGVTTDGVIVGVAVAGAGQGFRGGQMRGLALLLFLPALIDLPLSLALDVVVLPYTALTGS